MAEVRLAKPEDLRAIQALSHELFLHDEKWISHLNMQWPYEAEAGETYFKRVIAGSERLICLVAEHDGRVVGYLAGCLRKPEAYRQLKLAELENMIVNEGYRHHGIGKQLVSAFKAWCQEKGAQKILVIVSEPNAQAIQFYRSVGFEPYSLELEMTL